MSIGHGRVNAGAPVENMALVVAILTRGLLGSDNGIVTGIPAMIPFIKNCGTSADIFKSS
jgi:hypothetical protein